MKSREALSNKLHTICDNVYFQPDSNVKMKYPCIVYTLNRPEDSYADNSRFLTRQSYQITTIYKSLSNDMFDKVRSLFPHYLTCDTRHQITEGLYHDYYTLYW